MEEKDLAKVCFERIERELKNRNNSKEYIQGYYEAICDILWDMEERVLTSISYEEYCNKRGIKVIYIPHDKIVS
ncbi:MAG: hypothetical protein AABX30_01955 [Nanoarchaeota archaeon]